MNVTLTYSDNPLNTDNFVFGLETRNPKDIANFTFLLLNKKAELIEFLDNKKN